MDLGPGTYGILLTTFDEDDRVLDRDLAAQAEFVAATAQGVVWPVMASEFWVMSMDEIAAGFGNVARGVAGSVPFVAGVSQLTTQDAVRLTQKAAEAGADAVIAMAPFIRRAVGPTSSATSGPSRRSASPSWSRTTLPSAARAR